MVFREQLKQLTLSRPDQVLLLFGISLAGLTIISLWIDITLGVATLALFIAGAYTINVLLIRTQQRGVWTHYRQLEALHLLTSVFSFRLPLPPMREGAASPDLLLLLCQKILAHKPRCIVECGAGVSTLLIAYALEKVGHGQLVTLEHDPQWANRVGRWLEQHQLEAYAKVVYAPLSTQPVEGEMHAWYAAEAYEAALNALSPIEFLFVDGPPNFGQTNARQPAVPLLRPHLSEQCVIVMDDIERPDEAKTAHLWASQLHYHLTLFPNFDTGAALLQPIPPIDSRKPAELE